MKGMLISNQMPWNFVSKLVYFSPQRYLKKALKLGYFSTLMEDNKNWTLLDTIPLLQKASGNISLTILSSFVCLYLPFFF